MSLKWLSKNDFYETTDVSALNFINVAKSVWEKLFWAVLLLICFCFCIRDVGLLVVKWNQEPTETKITILHNTTLHLPKSTFCVFISGTRNWGGVPFPSLPTDEEILQGNNLMNYLEESMKNNEEILDQQWPYFLLPLAHRYFKIMVEFQYPTGLDFPLVIEEADTTGAEFYPNGFPKVGNVTRCFIDHCLANGVSLFELFLKFGEEMWRMFEVQITSNEGVNLKDSIGQLIRATPDRFCYLFHSDSIALDVMSQTPFIEFKISNSTPLHLKFDHYNSSDPLPIRIITLSFLEDPIMASESFHEWVVWFHQEAKYETQVIAHYEPIKGCSTTETMYACREHCRMHTIYSACGCMPFLRPEGAADAPVCELDDYLNCQQVLSDAKECQQACPQKCSQVTYETINVKKASTEDNQLLVRHAVKQSTFAKYSEEKFYDFDSFLGDLGGVIGFWLGIKFISVIYLLVYCTKTVLKKHPQEENCKQDSKKQQHWMEWNSFYDITPLSGFSFINATTSRKMVVFWYVVIYLCTALTIWDLNQLIEEWQMGPVVTEMKITNNQTLLLPDSLFCIYLNPIPRPQNYSFAEVVSKMEKNDVLNDSWGEFAYFYTVMQYFAFMSQMRFPEMSQAGDFDRILQRYDSELLSSFKLLEVQMKNLNIPMNDLHEKYQLEVLDYFQLSVHSMTIEATIRNDISNSLIKELIYSDQETICFEFTLSNAPLSLDDQSILSIQLHPNQITQICDDCVKGGSLLFSDNLLSSALPEAWLTFEIHKEMFVTPLASYELLKNCSEEESQFSCIKNCRSQAITDTCGCTPIADGEMTTPCEVENYRNCTGFHVDLDQECSKECLPSCKLSTLETTELYRSHTREGKPSVLLLQISSLSFPVLTQEDQMNFQNLMGNLGGVLEFWIGARLIGLVHLVIFLLRKAFKREDVSEQDVKLTELKPNTKRLPRTNSEPDVTLKNDQDISRSSSAPQLKKFSYATSKHIQRFGSDLRLSCKPAIRTTASLNDINKDQQPDKIEDLKESISKLPPLPKPSPMKSDSLMQKLENSLGRFSWLFDNKFYEETSIEGFPHIHRAIQLIECLFWYFVVILFAVLTIRSFSSLVSGWIDQETSTRMTLIDQPNPKLPKFSFCFSADIPDHNLLPTWFAAEHLTVEIGSWDPKIDLHPEWSQLLDFLEVSENKSTLLNNSWDYPMLSLGIRYFSFMTVSQYPNLAYKDYVNYLDESPKSNRSSFMPGIKAGGQSIYPADNITIRFEQVMQKLKVSSDSLYHKFSKELKQFFSFSLTGHFPSLNGTQHRDMTDHVKDLLWTNGAEYCYLVDFGNILFPSVGWNRPTIEFKLWSPDGDENCSLNLCKTGLFNGFYSFSHSPLADPTINDDRYRHVYLDFESIVSQTSSKHSIEGCSSSMARPECLEECRISTIKSLCNCTPLLRPVYKWELPPEDPICSMQDYVTCLNYTVQQEVPCWEKCQLHCDQHTYAIQRLYYNDYAAAFNDGRLEFRMQIAHSRHPVFMETASSIWQNLVGHVGGVLDFYLGISLMGLIHLALFIIERCTYAPYKYYLGLKQSVRTMAKHSLVVTAGTAQLGQYANSVVKQGEEESIV